MRFQASEWLLGSALALVVAIVFVGGGFLLLKAIRRFGDEPLVLGLVTGRPGGRRALKAGLLVTAVALAFAAMAQPQYGRGTRLIPATNLDIVIVLDYSKSMYARDIPPSRTLRAKSEVARLIGDLPGARFGAVAFAGQPIAFPLTSDGSAIAQFFRQLSPNDMPVGGTAIARALEAARELFGRDPLSKQHKKIVVLVTDGEDLEGDPVAVTQAAVGEEIAIHVVQVGGRTPEPIPEVNESGQVTGWRKDSADQPLTTALTAAGEEQLAKIAEVSGGKIVRSERGQTGIDVIAARLRQFMTEELSERTEPVWADVYVYPLALAVLFLCIETFINETKRRARPTLLPPPVRQRRRKRHAKPAAAVMTGLVLALSFALSCSKERSSLFERHAPPVDEAIEALDAGDAGTATTLLEQYLSTGKCEKGEIGTPNAVRERPNASFDLGIGLFEIAERFGLRFGEDPGPSDAGLSPEEQSLRDRRGAEIDCALRIVRIVGGDATVPADLRARALYLAGNLEFLRGDYETAVKSYDSALRIIPGLPLDAGDQIGTDAAHNRAIALRRIEEQKKNRPDGGPDAGSPDSGSPDGGDGDGGKNDQRPDAGGDDSKPDAGNNDSKPDAGDDKDKDGGAAPEPQAPDGGPPKPEPQQQSNQNQDDRILDQLEQAPTFQEHDAKNRSLTGRSQGMEDK